MLIEMAKYLLAGTIVNKLPLSWNDCKRRLKHDDGKYSLEFLQRYLLIVEESSNGVLKDYSKMETEVNAIDVNKTKQKNSSLRM